jgi:LemA protein
MTGIIFWILVVIGFFYVVSIFNRLISSKNIVKNAWSQVEVQLKRRHDLIPNLVEVAKMYMQHERETFEAVIRARAQVLAISSDKISNHSRLENNLSDALQSFYMVTENYPTLKANENFLKIQDELTTTENRIGYARQFYNDAVMVLNNITEMFPTNIIAGMFNFKPAEFFEIKVSKEREAPILENI